MQPVFSAFFNNYKNLTQLTQELNNRVKPMISCLMRFIRTVYYLKPIQIYGRILRKVRFDFSYSYYPSKILRSAHGAWINFYLHNPTLVGPTKFFILNEDVDLVHVGWDNPNTEKLCRYNLHYFEDLNSISAGDRLTWHLDLMNKWVKENPPFQGTGWEPYPTSLRIVNWIKWSLSGGELSKDCLDSLFLQVCWLIKNIEWHILGNHLFANAKALLFAGLYFEGKEAEIWCKKACDILDGQLGEQILADGCQFERSPMYNAIALMDMLDIYNLLNTYAEGLSTDLVQLGEEVEKRIDPMFRFLALMTHPDGEIALFNDAAFGIAPSLIKLIEYAEALGLSVNAQNRSGVNLAKDSGYVRIENGPVVAILDVALIGPDYLPGHAHADTLSFELSLYGQRLLVNSGTSCYGISEERLRQRGTKAHNTVVVNGENSSEVWSGFRVARRAYPKDLVIKKEGAKSIISCSHTGYQRIKKNLIHNRTWTFDEGECVIRDVVRGSPKLAVAYFHFHPDVHLHYEGDALNGRIFLPSKKYVTWRVIVGSVRIEESTYHPEFGLSFPNYCLAVELEDGYSEVTFFW